MAKKMIDYLPPFMQQFEEMKQLMQSEDKQVAALNMDTTKILRNAFMRLQMQKASSGSKESYISFQVLVKI